jgi:hypothetical protein
VIELEDLRRRVSRRLRAEVVKNYGELHAQWIELKAIVSTGRATREQKNELDQVAAAHALQCKCGRQDV